MCGDATSIDQLEQLCENQLVDMWLTDPPYNVAYEGKTADALVIKNGEMSDTDFRQFLADSYTAADAVMKAGSVFYIWHADSEGYNFRGAAHDIGWTIRQCLIWKNNRWLWGAKIITGNTSLVFTAGKMALRICGLRIASRLQS